jgi:hypothetical protein
VKNKTIVRDVSTERLKIVKLENSSTIYHLRIRENHLTDLINYQVEDAHTGKQVIDREVINKVKNTALTQG